MKRGARLACANVLDRDRRPASAIQDCRAPSRYLRSGSYRRRPGEAGWEELTNASSALCLVPTRFRFKMWSSRNRGSKKKLFVW